MTTSNIGLQVNNGIATGAIGFKEPAKRNIGIAMERERGVPGVIYEVSSLEDDYNFFGAPSGISFGGRIVKALFDNADPAPVKFFGTRIIGNTSIAATNTATTDDTVVTVIATAAYRGQDDPGTWGNDVSYSLYSFDSKQKNLIVFEVYFKGTLVETFAEVDMATLEQSINKRSSFITVSFSTEWPVTYTNLAGTATASTASSNVTGVGTAFLANVPVGAQLYNAAGEYIGRVKSVQSDTALTLQGNALVAVAGAAIKVRKDVVFSKQLSGGTYVAPVEADFYPVSDPANPKGLAIFDKADIQILIVTENHTLNMAKQGQQYCKGRDNCIFLCNLPLNADEQIIELYATTLIPMAYANGRNFIAGYADWDNVYNEDGDIVTIPSLGRVLGAGFLRVPYLQGDYVHIPPAGIDSSSVNVISLASGNYSQAQINRFVRNYNLNVSAYSPNYGRYILTSRMYSSNPLFQSIHVCMLTNFYTKTLLDNLLFVLQKLNTPELKKEVLGKLTTYFTQQYEIGALERSVPFTDALHVICDQSNNPLSQDRRILNVLIEFIPSESVESVVINLNRNDSLLTAKVN